MNMNKGLGGSPSTTISIADIIPNRMQDKLKLRSRGERKDFHFKEFKTPKECYLAIVQAAVNKSKYTWYQLVLLSFLAGIFCAFGATFAVSAAGGFTADFRATYPGLIKLIFGFTFPVGLVMIIMIGGELFTGNTMYMTAGILCRKTTLMDLVKNWTVSFIFNFAGCVACAYFLAYLTDIYSAQPWHNYITGLAETKTSLNWWVAFLRAVAANWMVNAAIFVSVASEDVVSKLFTALFIIAVFAVGGFEHCVANMYFIPLGMMYGADTNFGIYIYRSMIPTTLGNIVGGAIGMGVTLWLCHTLPFLGDSRYDTDGSEKKERSKDDHSNVIELKGIQLTV